jgi:hypothetical protein
MSSPTGEVLPGFRKIKIKNYQKEENFIMAVPLEQKLSMEAKALIDINSASEAKILSAAQVIAKVDEYMLLAVRQGGCVQYNKELNFYKAISLCNAFLKLHPTCKTVFDCLTKINLLINTPRTNKKCCSVS